MSSSWVAAHGISADAYQAQFDTLGPLGFRPRWIHGYREGSGARFSGVWERRPSARWEARHGIAAADYQAHFDAMLHEGLRLRCVSAYLNDGGVNYATLWDAEPSPSWEAHHGIPAADYQRHFDEMFSRGLRLVHVNACGIGGSAIFATIWEQRAGDWIAQHGLDAEAYQRAFDAHLADGFRLRQVCAYEVAGTDHYAALWDHDDTLAWQGRHGRDRGTYQLDFDDLRLAGYRPTCVTGCGTGAGARFAAVFDNYELSADALTLVDGEVAEFMDRFAVPGMSVAFTQGGRLVFARAFGYADAARAVTLRTRHRMRIASVAKPVTATTVFKLRARGAVRLRDLVFGASGLLGVSVAAGPNATNLKRIRLHHLLEHTSGAWDGESPPSADDHDGLDDPMFQSNALTQSQLITTTLSTYPVDAPGSRYAYSNFGYCLLGRVIERRTGRRYEDYVRRHVFAPIGATTFEIGGSTAADQRAWEVEYVGQGGEDPYGMNVPRMDAHGGWIATAVDVVRFAVHVDGVGGKWPLLDAASVAAMVTPTSLEANYARGWGVNADGNRWHLGSLPGSRSLLVTTANGMSWSALCNTRAPGGPADQTMGGALDDMMWRIVNGVPNWPTYDLF